MDRLILRQTVSIVPIFEHNTDTGRKQNYFRWDLFDPDAKEVACFSSFFVSEVACKAKAREFIACLSIDVDDQLDK